MSGKVGFYNPDEAWLSALDLTDWEMQDDTINESSERIQGIGADGDEIASDLVNATETVTLTMKCFLTAGTLPLPNIGTVTASGHHLDSISLTLNPTDWPTLRVMLHKHANGSSHKPLNDGGDVRTYKPSLSIKAGRGIPRAVTGAASSDYLGGFALGASDTALGISEVTYDVTCTHLDETGEDGNWLAGQNRDGVETFTINLTGTGATITPASGWDKINKDDSRGNTAADTQAASYEKHLAFDEGGDGESD